MFLQTRQPAPFEQAVVESHLPAHALVRVVDGQLVVQVVLSASECTFDDWQLLQPEPAGYFERLFEHQLRHLEHAQAADYAAAVNAQLLAAQQLLAGVSSLTWLGGALQPDEVPPLLRSSRCPQHCRLAGRWS